MNLKSQGALEREKSIKQELDLGTPKVKLPDMEASKCSKNVVLDRLIGVIDVDTMRVE